MRPVLVVSALALAACDIDLPPAYLVEDLRVLAVRTVEPELLVDAPADASVSFEALVVDPRGGPVTYAWRFCPVESDAACSDFEALAAEAPEAYRGVLAEMHAISDAGTALPIPESRGLAEAEAATRGVWGHDVPAFAVALPSTLVAYHLETSLLGFGAGSWPSVLLEVSGSSERATAQKRMVLSLRDLSAYAPLFEAQLGISICTADLTGECVAVAPRSANRNPEVAGFDYALTETAGGAMQPLVGPLSLKAGASVRLLPRFTEGSVELYELLRTDVNSRSIFVESVEEELSVQWFCSAGELLDTVTREKSTKGFDAAYTAPDAPPASHGRASLWLVVRDGRGGTGWTQLDVEVIP